MNHLKRMNFNVGVDDDLLKHITNRLCSIGYYYGPMDRRNADKERPRAISIFPDGRIIIWNIDDGKYGLRSNWINIEWMREPPATVSLDPKLNPATTVVTIDGQPFKLTPL